jgi:branched-chain amino acid transport system permease protein
MDASAHPKALTARSIDWTVVGRIALPCIVFAIALVGVPMMLGKLGMQFANIGGLAAIAAMALTVLTGTAGLLSLGHAAFLGIGAFAAGLLATLAGWPFFAAIIAAGFVGLAVGGGVALITLRTSGLYLAVGTFALQAVVSIVLIDIEVKVTAATGILMPIPRLFGMVIRDLTSWWHVIVTAMFLTYVLLQWQLRSHIGRAWLTTRDQPTVAAAMGISLLGARASVFMLTSFITSVCGAIGGYYFGIVQAANFDLHLAIKYITIVALGGLGSLPGAIVAAYAIILLPHVLTFLFRLAGINAAVAAAGSESIALAIILIAALLRVPQWMWRKLRGQLR